MVGCRVRPRLTTALVIIVAMVTACVMSVPDYHVQPSLLLQVSPYGPNVCAGQREKLTGKPFTTVSVFVHLRGTSDTPAVIGVNGREVEFASALGARLDYRAGLGQHRIVATAGGRTATHSLIVRVCDGT